MIVIYKIVSPSDKIYIGQSTNVVQRKRAYNVKNCKAQKKLYASLVKYGFDEHAFEVVYELPDDVTKEIVSEYEKFFIAQFKEAGFKMLNLMSGSVGGKHSAETIEKLKKYKGGKATWFGRKHTTDTKKKLSALKLGRRLSEVTKQKLSEINKGKPQSAETKQKRSVANSGSKNGFYGKTHTPEIRLKMREAKLGKKQDPEVVKKRIAKMWITRKAQKQSL